MEGHEGHNMLGHDMKDMPGHHMPDHHMPGHEMPAMCSMSMLFNWQIKDVCIVFEWWHIHNEIELFISCIVIFVIAAGYEYLRVWSASMDEQWTLGDKKKITDQRSPLVARHYEEDYETAATINTGSVDTNHLSRKGFLTIRHSIRHRILKSVIYATLVAISFWLMLVFMTYNGYLMAATVLGAGCGHFIFGHGKLKASRDIQCH
ncbi:Ctr copper transporter family-domain-containing protein [Cokeromyces recurvatus]|uniref:Ctr copper transporter family-domain-containing protein n=1 Tax=Cokeromyces recurvatus TaxID=90255 RepID=UPI00221ED621|nr:Ctr copper transporter family-domain-containing protein [Cokeromyces recurvatus]KAI7908066.1 Ctr copper transporter family-domain-containing protein [Cokeromyces recurvatus]